MAITVHVKDKIFKPVREVYDAIADPEQLSGYFVTRSSGPIGSGETLTWEWDDFGVVLEIDVLEVDPGHLIEFEWDAGVKQAIVRIMLNEVEDSATAIEITENVFELNEEEVAMALEQTQGWTDFICSLKAYLYTGINLRTGIPNS